ncbi:MAG TPA: molybdopterin-binding protein, partial [Limnochordia bacterium]|nr:molybdopterin-binding protein [Limnochordia bacterium]
MRKVPVQQAVGSVLCHDITRIIPGKVQEAAFKKGHVVREEDVEELLKLGKDHVYVWEPQPGMLHEDDAALRLAAAAAKAGIEWDNPSEGKVELKAAHPGVLRVDVEALRQVNSVEQVTLVTRRNHEPILKGGEQIAAARVIPLFIEEEKVVAAEKIMARAGGILEVTPFRLKRVGVVITGNEVYYGRIQDGFAPVLREKFAALGCEIVGVEYAPDDQSVIVDKILSFAQRGAEVIVATGGMSVDPDDQTPGAIKAAGVEIVSYGIPMLPGNMYLVGYLGDRPVMGLPGCVMFKEKTAFDYLVPRVLTGERLT